MTEELINNCIKFKDSYIMVVYSINILEGYIKSNTRDLMLMKNLVDTKAQMKMLISSKKSVRKIIDMDLKMLFMYKKLKNPDINNINEFSKKLLKIQINDLYGNLKQYILRVSPKYFKDISFFKDIEFYLQYVYTIKELNLDFTYKNFLVDFFKSDKYKIYVDNYMLINKTTRWLNSLLTGIKESE